jgi:hypothetical protein
LGVADGDSLTQLIVAFPDLDDGLIRDVYEAVGRSVEAARGQLTSMSPPTESFGAQASTSAAPNIIGESGQEIESTAYRLVGIGGELDHVPLSSIDPLSLV